MNEGFMLYLEAKFCILWIFAFAAGPVVLLPVNATSLVINLSLSLSHHNARSLKNAMTYNVLLINVWFNHFNIWLLQNINPNVR